jgi:hypothetical protein
MAERMMRFLKAYLYNLALSLSQCANAVLLAGDADESLSSRIGKALRDERWWVRPLRLWPRFVSHCLASIEDDEGGRSAARRQEFP